MLPEKRTLALAAMILTISLAAISIILASPSEGQEPQDVSSWTKAICTEDNYCIDVQITCVDGQVTDIRPMGPGVQFSSEWKDRRPEELKNGICV